MIAQFISVEIDLQKNPQKLQAVIEVELKKQGEPLRWAITSIDAEQQKVKVEAVVTKNSYDHP